MLAQPGQKTIEELKRMHGSVAEVLEKLVNKSERIKNLKAAQAELLKQSDKLKALCERDKRSIMNKFKSSESISSCHAFLDSGPWEGVIAKQINFYSRELVNEKFIDARGRLSRVEGKLLSSGKGAAAINTDPERLRWKEIVTFLQIEKDKLDKEYDKINEEVKERSASEDAPKITFLEKIGLTPGVYKPECFAKMDQETAKEIGCMK